MPVQRASSRLIIGAIVCWAGLLRFVPLLSLTRGTEFYHSGGLFYAFGVAIRESGFALPHTIPHYTLNGLPYAYPPLAFYAEALLQSLLGSGLHPNSVLFLNALFSTLAVITFGLLVLAMPELNGSGRWIALLAFATLPSAYLEQLPGEGLAESVGIFFFPLFLWRLYRLEDDTLSSRALTRSRIILGICLGLGVMAAPGTAYAMPMLLMLWLVLQLRQAPDQAAWRRRLVTFVTAAGVGMVVAAPYLLSVIAHHGIDVFLASFANEGSAIGNTLFGMFDAFTMRPYGGVIVPSLGQLLAIWGLLAVIIQRRTFLLLSTLFLISVPREGVWLSSVFLAILAGVGWQAILLPGFQSLAGDTGNWRNRQAVERALITVVVLGAGLSPVFTLAVHMLGDALYRDYATPPERAVLAMIEADTDPAATFLVMANEIEWFPLLADRTVLNVTFGTEWVPDKRADILAYNQRLSACETALDFQYLLVEMQQNAPDTFPLPDYVYLSKEDTFTRENPTADLSLIENVKNSPAFGVMYEDENVLVVELDAASVSSLVPVGEPCAP